MTTSFYAPASDDAGGIYFYGFPYVRTGGTCVRMYVLLYECVYVHMYIRTCEPDPVRLRLGHLYQV